MLCPVPCTAWIINGMDVVRTVTCQVAGSILSLIAAGTFQLITRTENAQRTKWITEDQKQHTKVSQAVTWSKMLRVGTNKATIVRYFLSINGMMTTTLHRSGLANGM